MQRHMKVKTALAGLAIAGGAAVAALAPASPALGFFSPPLLLEIHVNSPATLVAKGASADVNLQIECAGARTAFVSVSLTERAGSQIATGFGSTQIGCTNANQTVHVILRSPPRRHQCQLERHRTGRPACGDSPATAAAAPLRVGVRRACER
jgi:hypothetical protein